MCIFAEVYISQDLKYKVFRKPTTTANCTFSPTEDNQWYPKENMFSFQTATTTMQAWAAHWHHTHTHSDTLLSCNVEWPRWQMVLHVLQPKTLNFFWHSHTYTVPVTQKVDKYTEQSAHKNTSTQHTHYRNTRHQSCKVTFSLSLLCVLCATSSAVLQDIVSKN